MSAQTVTLAGKRYVLLPASEYERLTRRDAASELEDQRDAQRLKQRLKQMRQRRERPIPYAQARRELGIK